MRHERGREKRQGERFCRVREQSKSVVCCSPSCQGLVLCVPGCGSGLLSTSTTHPLSESRAEECGTSEVVRKGKESGFAESESKAKASSAAPRAVKALCCACQAAAVDCCPPPRLTRCRKAERRNAARARS